jgi:glycosyltransferase involved in cell wall biosynthesis
MYNRRDAHVMDFVPFMKEDIDRLLPEFNSCDAVIFNSYPSNKFPKESVIDFYEKLVKGITSVKVGFMHELNKTNIDKVPYIVGLMNQMDLIYNFSEKTWFSNTISELLPSKVLGDRVKKFTMWYNFDLTDNLRNSVKLEDKEKKLLYIGRWTTMKCPSRVLDLGPDLLKNGIKAELIGIERSIGAKFDIFEHPNTLDCTGKVPKPISENACVPVYSTYIREEGMKTLADSLFGCSFYRMAKDPSAYGDRMEYTQIEIIGVGSIPVFDIDWGKNNVTRSGKRYIDIPYSAVYSDPDNLQDTVDQLVKIANDPELQKKYQETSYNVVKEEFDANIVLPEMFNHILAAGIDKNKFSDDNQLMLALTENEEYVEEAKKQKAEGHIVVLGIRELTNGILCILDGKKELEIKKWKIKKEA